jgi:hypothetical protein
VICVHDPFFLECLVALSPAALTCIPAGAELGAGMSFALSVMLFTDLCNRSLD